MFPKSHDLERLNGKQLEANIETQDVSNIFQFLWLLGTQTLGFHGLSLLSVAGEAFSGPELQLT